jgi:Ni,Fe-hydrogenase maturation factor
VVCPSSIGEEVTGVLSLENLLIVCQHFGAFSKDVTIVEIEPQNEEYGMEFSPVVAAKVGEAIELVIEVTQLNAETRT